MLTSGAALTNATLPAGIKGVGALASGALTLSNLVNAFKGDDDLNKVTATLNAANTVNNLFQGTPVYSEGLSTFLNGSTTTGVSGVGAIAASNLVSAVRNEYPIGVATSLGTLIEGASFLTSNPVGWALLGQRSPKPSSPTTPPTPGVRPTSPSAPASPTSAPLSTRPATALGRTACAPCWKKT